MRAEQTVAMKSPGTRVPGIAENQENVEIGQASHNGRGGGKHKKANISGRTKRQPRQNRATTNKVQASIDVILRNVIKTMSTTGKYREQKRAKNLSKPRRQTNKNGKTKGR